MFSMLLLKSVNFNADIKLLMKEIRNWSIWYEAVFIRGVSGAGIYAAGKEDLQAMTSQAPSDGWQKRLEMADERLVQEPRKGWKFSGWVCTICLRLALIAMTLWLLRSHC